MSQEITEDNLENLDNLKSEISILTRSDGSAIFYQGIYFTFIINLLTEYLICCLKVIP